MTNKLYDSLTVHKLEDSRLEIMGTVAWGTLEGYYTRVLEKLTQETEVDGFRKGKAPANKVEETVGVMRILQDAAQTVLGDVYPQAVMDNSLQIIGYPEIAITKIAHGEELGFTITTAVMPEITLGDYSALAKKHNSEESTLEVTDEEFDAEIERMKQMYQSMQQPQEQTEGEESPEVPEFELTDEFVKQLGDYESADAFKAQFREDMLKQKQAQELGVRREALVTAIAEDSTCQTPAVLVEVELDKMMAAMKDDVTRMGLEYAQWLEHSGKKEEDLRSDMQADAEKRAQVELILKEIARVEDISPDADKVAEQKKQILEMHKDVEESHVDAYLENVFLNEAVLNFLENIK